MSDARNPIDAAGEDEIEVLARTIFGEARGEPVEGQIAVAYCIVHRAQIAKEYVSRTLHRHPLYGNGTIRAACQAPLQFSCWNDGDPTKARMLAVTLADPAYRCAHDIAEKVIKGEAEDGLPGTTHYFNPDVVAAPKWAAGLPYTTIGHHRFFRDVT